MERLTVDEMLECLGEYADHESAKQLIAMIEELKQYKDAEEQGLLLRLLCKVGDTVYCIEDKQVWCCTIEKISISKNNGTWIEISFPEEMPSIASMEFYPNEIGKTVFLTEEEAEAKLKEIVERSGHDENSEALQMAIEALEEIQQYRAIGTMEECRAAVEQKAKKVIEKYKAKAPEDIEAYGEDAVFGYCPVCGGLQNTVWNTKYCGDCGQKLDWSDEE